MSYIFTNKLKISKKFKTENNQLKKFERSQSSQFTNFCIGKNSYKVKFQLFSKRKLKPASILCCFWCFTRLLIQLLTQCVFYRKLVVLKESNSNRVVKIFFTRFVCFFSYQYVNDFIISYEEIARANQQIMIMFVLLV